MPKPVPFYRVQPWSVLTALCLTVSLASFTALDPVVAQEQQFRTLTVTGQGLVSIPTSLTQVQLGVEVEGKTANEVQQEAARRSAAVVALLKSRNVEKLETTGIRLEPLYNYANNQRVLMGYVATNVVSFRLPTDQAGSILDDAVKAGATRIEGVSFIAADSAIKTAQQQALRQATQDAQMQADAVLSTLNLSRREVIGIQINGASAPPPMPVFRSLAKAEDAATTPVIGGEQQVSASVTLQISY